jgi:glycosyltransferase involved in cell wall biosynthesis
MRVNKRLVSIISPCYNEEENIEELYQRAALVFDKLKNYDFEFLFIDNASTDQTVSKLRKIAEKDSRVKVIINTRNFGHLRSPYYGLLQTKGDASIYLASDLQDPPELIPDFLKKWEEGAMIVLAVKPISTANPLMHKLRRLYYTALDKISDVQIIKDATGFGLYDKVVLTKVREINDPYPYFRGLVCELGFGIETINFNQPRRIRGVSKNNFYSLYDIAMLGIISHSLVPIRIASIAGFALGVFSVLLAIILLVVKIAFWNNIPVGVAPIAIIMLFMFGIVLIFIGMLGEYIGSIHTYLKNRPVVVEKERINF